MSTYITPSEIMRLESIWGKEFVAQVLEETMTLFGPDVGILQVYAVAIGKLKEGKKS